MGLYRDNGKEKGDYCLGFRVYGFVVQVLGFGYDLDFAIKGKSTLTNTYAHMGPYCIPLLRKVCFGDGFQLSC